MQRFVKQPAEVVTLAVDFSTVPLGEGETIVSAEVTAAHAATGADASALLQGAPRVWGTQVLHTVGGGADGDRVRLSFRAVTSQGHTYEEDLLVIVREL